MPHKSEIIEDEEIRDVREFNRKFNFIVAEDGPQHLTNSKLMDRITCLREEINEFTKAAKEQDIEEMADALIDLVYFAKGTAVMMGLPWRVLWKDVQRANMSKVPGITKRNMPADVTKPEGWKGPKTKKILRDFGYNPCKFMIKNEDGVFTGAIVDSLCVGDGK